MGRDDTWLPLEDDDTTPSKEKPQDNFNRPIATIQYLIAGTLMGATNTTLNHKIELICEAGFALDWGKKGASTLEGIRMLFRMNTAITLAFHYQEDNYDIWSIRWHPDLLDSDELYNMWFKAWDDNYDCYNSKLPPSFNTLPPRLKFKERTAVLTYSGYQSLKSVFFAFAMPRAMRYYVAICKHLDYKSLEPIKETTFKSFQEVH